MDLNRSETMPASASPMKSTSSPSGESRDPAPVEKQEVVNEDAGESAADEKGTGSQNGLPANAVLNASRLYQQVADRLRTMIEQGTLRPGQRVPSIRRMADQMNVSIATVLQAYRVLEDARLIESRPQSGYYVRGQYWSRPPEPEISAPALGQTPVSVADLVLKVVQATIRPDMIPFGSAIVGPELLPTQQFNRLSAAMARRTQKMAHQYDFPPGCPELRVQVARRALDCGCTLSPDDLVTTFGTQEALALCLKAVAREGDAIAIESPVYYGILQLLEALGMRAVEIPTSPRDGMSITALEQVLQQHPIKAVMLISNVSNPLGCTMSDSSKEQLVQLLARHDVPLIEDDIFGELYFGPTRPRTCKAYDTAGRVMLCSSISKTLSPGARVGWCAPGRYLSQVLRLKLCHTIGTATIPQLAVAEFLANGGYDHHLRRVRKLYAQQLRLMSEAVTRYFPAETRITRPGGGFLLWVEMPEQVDSLELHRRALLAGISITPGPLFSPTRRYKNFIRLNCGFVYTQRIEQAVATLGELVKSLCATKS